MFQVDWERRITCPAGHGSISWLASTHQENGMVWEACFARRDCTPCPLRPHCTRAKREPHIIGLQAREHFEALQGARKHQEAEAFRASYVARAGIEGTHAQAISRCGLRRSRHIGLAKTHLQHVITAAAVNLVRIAEWFAGTPVARTRPSRFAALQPPAWSATEFATNINVGAGVGWDAIVRRVSQQAHRLAAIRFDGDDDSIMAIIAAREGDCSGVCRV